MTCCIGVPTKMNHKNLGPKATSDSCQLRAQGSGLSAVIAPHRFHVVCFRGRFSLEANRGF